MGSVNTGEESIELSLFVNDMITYLESLRNPHVIRIYKQVKRSAAAVARSCLCGPWTAAHQDPLSMGLPRQEYWNGLPFPLKMA